MRRIAFALAAVLLIAATDARTETEHTVGSGETLKSIARRAGVPLTVIAEANGLPEEARVHLGQRLLIPRQQSHTVTRGETRFSIAYQYGVSWEQIATANGLAPAATIRPGQRLIIPALLQHKAVAPPLAPLRPPAPLAPLTPEFRRPIEGPVLLGWQRRGSHQGLDFAAADGDRVRAAAAGTVIFAGDEPTRFGKLVVLDHGSGWHTAYGNLSRITVKRGDTVKAGERIGLAGHTGDAKQPQLHFEIRRGDKAVDPAPLLPPPN